MKKLLLTLGAVASVATPLVTIAIFKDNAISSPVSYDSSSMTLTYDGFVMNPGDEHQTYDDLIKEIDNKKFYDATRIVVNGNYGDYTYEGVADITTMLVEGQSFENIGELLNFNFASTNAWIEIFNASAIDTTTIEDSVKGIELTSYQDDNGASWDSEELVSAKNAKEADELFGINQFEFNKLIDSFEDEWVFDTLTFVPSSPTEDSQAGYKSSIGFSSISQPHREFENIESTDIVNFNTALNENLIIEGEELMPTQDKFILMKDHYHNGVLWSGNNVTGSEVQDEYIDIPLRDSIGFTSDVIQMEDGDSIVAVYDEDDLDGINVNNFEDTVGFVDTALDGHSDILDINLDIGNGFIEGAYNTWTMVGLFDNGKLLPYIGSQTMHGDSGTTLQNTLKIISYQVEVEVFIRVLEFYGFKNEFDENGDYVNDPNNSGTGSSNGFTPTAAENGFFSYEQIAKNATKITYNNSDSGFGLPAASFAFINHVSGDEYALSNYAGTYSYGENSWKRYEEHAGIQYDFLSRKNIFLTQ